MALSTWLSVGVQAQSAWSERMVESVMRWHPDSIVVGGKKTALWNYEQGFVLKGIERVWTRTGHGRYFEYLRQNTDRFLDKEGNIRTYKRSDYNLDHVASGRTLLTLYQKSLPDRTRYRQAADRLWAQLGQQPRTPEGGYWHKQRYPHQMWLDGLFMAEPFAAEYSALFGHPEHFQDIARQFALIEARAVDEKTGLIYHAFDASRKEPWADPKTGRSGQFWGRAVGWYAMALVDVLDYFPADHPERKTLIGYLQRLAPVLLRYQDASSGLWYQILDQAGREGNYPEASASCMFVYALAKGTRLGYLPATYAAAARKGYEGVLSSFVKEETDGTLSLHQTVSVGGLGGSPYRDGSYEYYLSEPLRTNDLKGVGAFIFASLEMEIAAGSRVGEGKSVLLDTYFNREFRPGTSGQPEPYHYTWDDQQHSGFWLWGTIFRDLGAQTRSLPEVPTAGTLAGADVYIIVDPDTPRETAQPNYLEATHRAAIRTWVERGGVLVLMANDTANCEIPRFNQLAGLFGIRFTDKNRNRVQGSQFEQGRIDIPAGTLIFGQTRAVYIKELAPLALAAPAEALVTDQGDVILARAKYGKGTVLAVGDPWLYNEYVDGRKIPPHFQNFRAAQELSAWLLAQVPAR
ncbi:hypothetical protein GCM10027275_18080 [Rhabdobacter roseus]|nr:DUF4350 domain-containing protein [Rhabdobacter roseus]